MLRNWFVIAIRNLVRHKLFTAINALGLALGLAAALTIAVFVRHELSYDAFMAKGGRIHLAWSMQFMPGREPVHSPVLSLPMGRLLAERVPEIEDVVQMAFARQILRFDGDSRFQNFAVTSSAYFRMFDVDLVAGDPATALDQPFSIVLGRTVAVSLFGGDDVLGRTLTTANGDVLTVTGVMEDPPLNSNMLESALLSISSPLPWLERIRESWGQNSFRTFVLLREGVAPTAVIPSMQAAAAAVVPNYNSPGTGPFSFELRLTALDRLHLSPEVNWRATSPDVVAAFLGLAVLLLAIATINFVNLSTARASLRTREVGLRKTLGASRGLLFGQFMGEALTLTLLAGVIAIAVVELSLPTFIDLLGVRIDEQYRSLGVILGVGVPIAFLVGAAGGVYPSLVLSSFRPAVALQGRGGAIGSGRLRALLVVLQFAAAIGLAICTWVILDQTRYAQSSRLGFTRENVVLLRGVPDGDQRWRTLRDRLRAEPGVVHAAGAAWVPTDQSESTSNYVVIDGPRAGEEMTFRTERSDLDYLKTIDATLLAGRLFDEGRPADQIRGTEDGGAVAASGTTAAAVVSRGLIDALRWGSPEQALGRTMTLGRGDGALVLSVIGVVDDVQFGSVRQHRVPTVFLAYPDDTTTLVVRVQAGAMPDILARIDALWRETYADRPVSRQFLDEQVERLYVTEQRQAKVLGLFAGLAIIIACLGLFGLASFTAERRTREIGIRKVLGASMPEIVRLLVWQFSRPVLWANLLAWPVAWFAMEHWLGGFAYRIDLSLAPFLVAGLAALLIAWATVAGHAARVASRNPVSALRHE